MQDALGFNRPGGSPWPIADPDSAIGQGVTMIGADAPFGSVVMAGVTDADPLMDSGEIDGPKSHLQTVELPSNATLYGRTGFFYVTQTKATHLRNTTGPAISGPQTLQARVLYGTGVTSLAVGTPLMADFSGTPGVLIAYDDTNTDAKPIAKVAKTTAGTAEAESLVWVHFDGARGWG